MRVHECNGYDFFRVYLLGGIFEWVSRYYSNQVCLDVYSLSVSWFGIYLINEYQKYLPYMDWMLFVISCYHQKKYRCPAKNWYACILPDLDCKKNQKINNKNEQIESLLDLWWICTRDPFIRTRKWHGTPSHAQMNALVFLQTTPGWKKRS